MSPWILKAIDLVVWMRFCSVNLSGFGIKISYNVVALE